MTRTKLLIHLSGALLFAGVTACPPKLAPAPPDAAGSVTAAVAPRDAASAPERALSQDQASRLASLALGCVHQEYPNKLAHVMASVEQVRPPRELHPAFYGCYDWHSAVHGHWMLVRLLKRFPALPEAAAIRAALDANLRADSITVEVRYLGQKHRASFERTYGWAWLLKLAEELHGWDDADARRWSAALAPLATAMRDRYLDFLPRQTYPIRRGVHPNTAFGIAFALDYARAVGDQALEALLVERSLAYFGEDAACPARWEPDGDDFFSRCLTVADLMRRVLPEDRYPDWLRRFLPDLARGAPRELLWPAEVSDRSDPKIVHLDGLNLSRAWCMRGISTALPEEDDVAAILHASAERHLDATLPHVSSGEYSGEHWLASFAVYALSLPAP